MFEMSANERRERLSGTFATEEVRRSSTFLIGLAFLDFFGLETFCEGGHIMVLRTIFQCVLCLALVAYSLSEDGESFNDDSFEDPAWFSLLKDVRPEIVEEARYSLREGSTIAILIDAHSTQPKTRTIISTVLMESMEPSCCCLQMKPISQQFENAVECL
jgi:hypothetical protein